MPNRDRWLRYALLALIGVAMLSSLWLLPQLQAWVGEHLSPGMGLKEAAIWAFGVTMVTLVVLAVAAGDGLLGELQFMVGAFFLYFVWLWGMIAWIF